MEMSWKPRSKDSNIVEVFDRVTGAAVVLTVTRSASVASVGWAEQREAQQCSFNEIHYTVMKPHYIQQRIIIFIILTFYVGILLGFAKSAQPSLIIF